MNSLTEIKEQLEKHFECRYHPFRNGMSCYISFIEPREWTDDTVVIRLFITKNHNTIKLIKNKQHIKFPLIDFLDRIKQELIASVRNDIVGYYKEYIIIRN